MKKIILILVVLILVFGCVKQTTMPEPAKDQKETTQTEKVDKDTDSKKQGLVVDSTETKVADNATEAKKEIPGSYQIKDVSYYGEKNFCYGASAMMLVKHAGFTEEQVQTFRSDIKAGPGGPPDMFTGFKKSNIIDNVMIGYSKQYNSKDAKLYNSFLSDPEKQIMLFESKDEAFKQLKMLISSAIPVIVLIHNGNHYVVATGYDKDYVYTNDPGFDEGYDYKIDGDPNLKQRRIPVTVFLDEWTLSKQDTGGKAGFPGDYGMVWLEKAMQTKSLKDPIEDRLDILEKHLHSEGSGKEAKELFPDLVKVYVDENNSRFPIAILPFTYYYSKEANSTISICNIGYTVFVCDGKLDRLITESDYDNCKVADAYLHPEKYA